MGWRGLSSDGVAWTERRHGGLSGNGVVWTKHGQCGDGGFLLLLSIALYSSKGFSCTGEEILNCDFQ